ncbi:MAG: twin-arginine translocase TatA/TatE family subunit [Chloroflexi bacterium]|nr:twin-arginine translocase TatA/TatE family subunit [Chloroflexota bacterium]
MFGSLGAPELLIIGAVIILIFGVGKISGLGRELGSSIKEFRKAVKDEDAEAAKGAQQQTAAPPPPPQQYQQPQAQYTPPPPPSQQPPAAPTDQKNPTIF